MNEQSSIHSCLFASWRVFVSEREGSVYVRAVASNSRRWNKLRGSGKGQELMDGKKGKEGWRELKREGGELSEKKVKKMRRMGNWEATVPYHWDLIAFICWKWMEAPFTLIMRHFIFLILGTLCLNQVTDIRETRGKRGGNREIGDEMQQRIPAGLKPGTLRFMIAALTPGPLGHPSKWVIITQDWNWIGSIGMGFGWEVIRLDGRK